MHCFYFYFTSVSLCFSKTPSSRLKSSNDNIYMYITGEINTDTARRVGFVCSDTLDLCVKTFSGILTMGDIGLTEKHTNLQSLQWICVLLFVS